MGRGHLYAIPLYCNEYVNFDGVVLVNSFCQHELCYDLAVSNKSLVNPTGIGEN